MLYCEPRQPAQSIDRPRQRIGRIFDLVGIPDLDRDCLDLIRTRQWFIDCQNVRRELDRQTEIRTEPDQRSIVRFERVPEIHHALEHGEIIDHPLRVQQDDDRVFLDLLKRNQRRPRRHELIRIGIVHHARESSLPRFIQRQKPAHAIPLNQRRRPIKTSL